MNLLGLCSHAENRLHVIGGFEVFFFALVCIALLQGIRVPTHAAFSTGHSKCPKH